MKKFRTLRKVFRFFMAWGGFFLLTIPFLIGSMLEFIGTLVVEGCKSFEAWAFREHEEDNED